MLTSKLHILYIEDNLLELQLISRHMKYMGYLMLSATNAQDGIRLAQTQAPRLILMDIHLPDMNGIEATQLLKASPELKHIPVVILTSDMTDAVYQASRDAGCDAFLEKPINKVSLLRTINQFVYAVPQV